MSNRKTVIGDKMLETQIQNKSIKLNITPDEVIEHYIKRELYCDDYYEPTPLTREELTKMSKLDIEKDKKRGYPPVKHDFSVFIKRWSEND